VTWSSTWRGTLGRAHARARTRTGIDSHCLLCVLHFNRFFPARICARLIVVRHAQLIFLLPVVIRRALRVMFVFTGTVCLLCTYTVYLCGFCPALRSDVISSCLDTRLLVFVLCETAYISLFSLFWFLSSHLLCSATLLFTPQPLNLYPCPGVISCFWLFFPLCCNCCCWWWYIELSFLSPHIG
jgi:hypothetical protein